MFDIGSHTAKVGYAGEDIPKVGCKWLQANHTSPWSHYVRSEEFGFESLLVVMAETGSVSIRRWSPG